MPIASIHNLLAKLDSTFTKTSADTNFYQLLQLVAHEIDGARRELQFTKTDNYFYNVRDDQLFDNLGVLLKINKQPAFTKRKALTVVLKLTVEEDLSSRPTCLNERLTKLTVEWETELDTSSEVDYSLKPPFILPGSPNPITGLFDTVNERLLVTLKSTGGKKHQVIIPGLKFGSELFFLARSTNKVGEIRQTDFIHYIIPPYPIIAPIMTTEEPLLHDGLGFSLRTPLDEDPYGFRQYRKILYGVLKSYLTGPTPKGIEYGLQPFFDLPVEVVENFPSIPDLYITNAIEPIYEDFVHTFQVSVILNDVNKARALGELNEQVQDVLNYIKPAHTLPRFQFVIPDHFFSPTDNPYGSKKAIALEPTIGPSGEKVYINPSKIDLGYTSYYEDVLGYRRYCEFSINYLGLYCYYDRSKYEYTTKLHSYYDVLDRNYFYIQNGERLVTCAFIKVREVELLLEHRNSADPLNIRIEGDVDHGANTFQDIPYATKINVVLSKGNGPKTIHITFIYPEQLKTNRQNRYLNEDRLGSGSHGEVTVDAVVFLINTIPESCNASDYIDDTATILVETLTEERNVLQQSFGFILNDESSVLNGPHFLLPNMMDQQGCSTQGCFNSDGCLITNLDNRRLNDVLSALGPECCIGTPEIEMESSICDTFANDILVLNAYDCNHERCDCMPRVLNRSNIILPEFEFFGSSGNVVVEEYRIDRAFILNGVEQYNTRNDPFYNTSLMNIIDGPVMSPITNFDLEPWNPFLKDKSRCQHLPECRLPCEVIEGTCCSR